MHQPSKPPPVVLGLKAQFLFRDLASCITSKQSWNLKVNLLQVLHLFLWFLISLFADGPFFSAHFQWNRFRTCYLFNKIDGVTVTGSPCDSKTVKTLLLSDSTENWEMVQHGISVHCSSSDPNLKDNVLGKIAMRVWIICKTFLWSFRLWWDWDKKRYQTSSCQCSIHL